MKKLVDLIGVSRVRKSMLHINCLRGWYVMLNSLKLLNHLEAPLHCKHETHELCAGIRLLRSAS